MKRVAIADDHKLFRKGMMGLINGFTGFEVTVEASNGTELLQLLKNNSVDIIVMDINMPKLNGVETTKRLVESGNRATVLALSMYEDELSVISMLKAGAKGYVLKDAEPEELRRALNDVMDKGFYYSNIVGSLVLSNIQEERNELNERELNFLRLACTELTYKEIADKMFVSPRTVDGYRESLFVKLDVKSRIGLVVYAIKHGIFKIT